MTIVSVYLGNLIQHDLFQFHLFAYNVHDFVLLYSQILFFREYVHALNIHFLVEEHVGCFNFLATTNREATNMAEKASVEWDVKSL